MKQKNRVQPDTIVAHQNGHHALPAAAYRVHFYARPSAGKRGQEHLAQPRGHRRLSRVGAPGVVQVHHVPEFPPGNAVIDKDTIDDYLSDDGETFTVRIQDDTYTNASAYENVIHDTTPVTTTIHDEATPGPEDTVYVQLSGDATQIEAEGAALTHTIRLVDKDGNDVALANGESVTINLKPDGRNLRFVRAPWKGGPLEVMSEQLIGSGHPTLYPDGVHILTDSYAYEPFAAADGSVPIRWADLRRGTEQTLVMIGAQPAFWGPRKELRVDPHPAWDRNWDWIAFNGFEEDTRRVYIADVREIARTVSDSPLRTPAGAAQQTPQAGKES